MSSTTSPSPSGRKPLGEIYVTNEAGMALVTAKPGQDVERSNGLSVPQEISALAPFFSPNNYARHFSEGHSLISHRVPSIPSPKLAVLASFCGCRLLCNAAALD